MKKRRAVVVVLVVAGALALVASIATAIVLLWLDAPSGELAPGVPAALERPPPLTEMPRAGALRATLVATAPHAITSLTNAHDGSGRLFVTERRGRILVLDRGAFRREPLLDIRSLVESGGQEQGLLSVAFAPRDPRTFYVNYTSRRGGGDTVVARYRIGDAAAASGLVADPAPVRVLLTIDQPASNHNGGQLQFGPDGFLYVGMGDGGIAHDPWNNAERLDVLLGKMLRLDVSGDGAYRIPPDNPFVARRGARPEIWAYGLRNPWRFSFDRVTGDLYIGDVGQNAWEEIDVAPRSSRGGEHYGWDRLEGVHCHEPAGGCDPRGTTLPAVTYGRDGGCSVTGGYVYRGARIEALRGTYVFGDYCTGKIWGMRRNPSATSSASAPWQRTELLDTDILLASFGEDEAGELYLLDLRGGVYRLDAASG